MSEVGGIGMELYFRMLRLFGYCFAFMSVVTSPIAVFSWNGNFVPDTGNFFAKTTVGNLGLIRNDLYQPLRHVVVKCQAVELTKLTPLFGWLDMCSLLIFMGFMAYLRFKVIPKAHHESEQVSITTADFGVEIDFLPRTLKNAEDHKRYKELLKEHLETQITAVRTKEAKGGCCKRARQGPDLPAVQVHEISLIRDYNKRLKSIKRRAECVRQKEIYEYIGDPLRAEKCEKEIAKKNAKLAESFDKDEDELPVIRAYAIIDLPHDVDGLKVWYRFGNAKLTRSANVVVYASRGALCVCAVRLNQP
jgi:hypothetical protein